MTGSRTAAAGGALCLLAVRAGGILLGAAFGVTAALRRDKPLHPIGAVVNATWHVVRPAGLGVPLLDAGQPRRVLVRLSRAASLTHSGWDIMGLALRAPGAAADGRDADLLFATTGAGPWTRYVLLPRRTWGVGDYTTLLPLAWRGGSLVLRLHARSVTEYQVSVSTRGHLEDHSTLWTVIGRLVLDSPPTEDQPLRFRPAASPPAGLTAPTWVRALRQPAYQAARQLARLD